MPPRRDVLVRVVAVAAVAANAGPHMAVFYEVVPAQNERLFAHPVHELQAGEAVDKGHDTAGSAAGAAHLCGEAELLAVAHTPAKVNLCRLRGC